MVNLSHPAARAPCLHCAVILKACYCTQPCKGKIGGGKPKHFLSLHKPRGESGKIVQNHGLIFIV